MVMRIRLWFGSVLTSVGTFLKNQKDLFESIAAVLAIATVVGATTSKSAPDQEAKSVEVIRTKFDGQAADQVKFLMTTTNTKAEFINDEFEKKIDNAKLIKAKDERRSALKVLRQQKSKFNHLHNSYKEALKKGEFHQSMIIYTEIIKLIRGSYISTSYIAAKGQAIDANGYAHLLLLDPSFKSDPSILRQYPLGPIDVDVANCVVRPADGDKTFSHYVIQLADTNIANDTPTVTPGEAAMPAAVEAPAAEAPATAH